MVSDSNTAVKKEDNDSSRNAAVENTSKGRATPVKAEESETNKNKTPLPSSSPIPQPASSPSNSASNRNSSASHPAPIMTNSTPNRPPSTTSVHSNSSTGGAPRTTATSRRGGRTRCRSPPAMINRPASTGPPPPAPEHYSPRPPVDDTRGPAPPPSPANPSAAAAAAAAAAKSITRNPPPPSSWYESPDAPREYGRRPHRDSSRYHPSSGRYYDQHHRNWPPQEGEPPSRSTGGSRYRSRGEDPYSYHEGYYRGGRSSRGGDPYHQYEEGMEYNRRYPDHPSSRSAPYDEQRMGRRERSTSPHPYEYRGGRDHHRREHPRDHHREHPREHPRDHHRDHHREHPRDHRPREHPREHPRDHPREDPYYKKDHDGSRAEAGAPSSLKRTTRVIGTATPIHVPRAPEPSRSSRGGSAASVFRGRPGSDLRPSSRGEPPAEEDGPQKILMALRTPSTSFEEKPPKNPVTRRSPNSSDPLSPEEPPQIQHSHHQSASDSNLFFEPQRSPKSTAGPPQPTNSIDMAPSFSLFNQSFDSIGDTAQFFNVGGPLDAALQSTSFGAGPTASDGKGDELQLSASHGTFSQQLLGGSGSGALTFGMSPSNSFGGGASTLRGGNMMLLGGQDNRSSSPSQVLDMYRSYSNGGVNSPRPKGGPVDDSHVRSSGAGGNLNSPSISNSYTRSFGGEGPGHYRRNSFGPPEQDGSPVFYAYLKKHKDAFKECTFLMPGLKAALQSASFKKDEHASDTPKRHTRGSDAYGEPNPQDIAIAARRVASAVCAFGGTMLGDRPSVGQQKPQSQSIFREKPGDAPTKTTSSSQPNSPSRSRQKARYDEALPGRYYENDNRLSWEFEENPPVDISDDIDDDASDMKREDDDGDDKSKNGSSPDGGNRGRSDTGDSASQAGTESGKKTPTPSTGGDQPKMRYRCKLCGQPKQNHTCPYQQSLARSIGTMVYPAVNAFTSAEPGILAPALSEMNNFINSGGESVSSAETSPSRPTPDRMRHMNQGMPPNSAQVTPESLRGATRGSNSPISTISSSAATPQRSRTPASSSRVRAHSMGNRYTPGSSARKKRSHAQMEGSESQGELLFVEAMELKPEQFRIVTPSKAVNSPDAFTYPALPLPYAQRKRLSDNLFSLSKEVPQLTDECASVLREAREKDLWDLAVAELMTQVVVVVHCQDGDSRFDGLRRYLLSLGISC